MSWYLYHFSLSVFMWARIGDRRWSCQGQGQVKMLSGCPGSRAPPEPHKHTNTLTRSPERWRPCFLAPSCLPRLDPDPSVTLTSKHTHTFLYVYVSVLCVKNRPSNIKRMSDVWESPLCCDERQKGTETSKWGRRWKWVSEVMRCNWEKWRRDRTGGIREGAGVTDRGRER